MTLLSAAPRPIAFAVPDIDDDDVAAVTRVLRSGWLTTGSECAELEQELARMVGAPHAVAVSSCTAALEIAYASLALPDGARVGVPTWTFVASALGPHRYGARPVLLDVDEDTLNLSVESVERAVAAGLDCLIAVHFGGVPVDARIHEVCAAAGVPVIEDAAHSLGACDARGAMAGAGSVAACLSFYATKNLSCGEGGALVTERDDVADFARSFRLHGLSRDAWARYHPGGRAEYELIGPGIKANLPDLLAALARSQLARFEAIQARRRALIGRYRAGLAGVDGLRFAPRDLAPDGADHLCVVVLPEGTVRDDVVAALDAASIGTSVHFRSLHHFEWFAANAEIGPGGVATADAMAGRVLSLPLHPQLTDADVDRVCEAVAAALQPTNP